MRGAAFVVLIEVLSISLVANAAVAQGIVRAQNHIGVPTSSEPLDESGARRFLADSGELVTLYGSRRFDPYYEPGRPAPPTDPITGWPVDWSIGAYTLVGAYSPYGYRYSPYGYGYYHSYYRPRYVPYGYGYGWGYRYPFGYYPWRAYGYYRPWSLDQAYGWESPHVDYGPSFLSDGVVVSPPFEYGGCFFW